MNNRVATSLLKQKAVYWGTPVNDGFGGFTYADPIELRCRWVDRQVKFIANDAEEKVSKSIVLIDPTKTIAIKGMIALLSISDMSSDALPSSNNAFEVEQILKTSDRSGAIRYKKVLL